MHYFDDVISLLIKFINNNGTKDLAEFCIRHHVLLSIVEMSEGLEYSYGFERVIGDRLTKLFYHLPEKDSVTVGTLKVLYSDSPIPKTLHTFVKLDYFYYLGFLILKEIKFRVMPDITTYRLMMYLEDDVAIIRRVYVDEKLAFNFDSRIAELATRNKK